MAEEYLSAEQRETGSQSSPVVKDRHGRFFDLERYNRKVTLLKIILPAAVFLLIATMTILLLTQEEKIPDIAPAEPIGQAANKNAQVMNKTEFTGLDNKGQPYVIEADQVIKGEASDAPLEMVAPRAVLYRSSDKTVWSRVQANRGLYQQDAERIELSGDVTLTDSANHKYVTHHLVTDLSTFETETDSKVLGFGPTGSIRSNGLHISARGDIITLKGPATVLLK